MPDSRRFRLTLQCLELGFSALSANGLPEHAAPLLRELVPDIGDAASLSVMLEPLKDRYRKGKRA